MIRVNNIKLSPKMSLTKKVVADKLRVSEGDIVSYSIYRKSIDARKKDNVFVVYTVDVQVKNEGHIKYGEKVNKEEYEFPKCTKNINNPLIVGSGPAGLFAALMLVITPSRNCAGGFFMLSEVIMESSSNEERISEQVGQCAKCS